MKNELFDYLKVVAAVPNFRAVLLLSRLGIFSPLTDADA